MLRQTKTKAGRKLLSEAFKVARMLNKRQMQKETRACGGLLSLFDEDVKLAREAPPTYPNVPSS